MNKTTMRDPCSSVGSLLLLSAYVAYGNPAIVPTLDRELGETNTVIYCPTILVAWEGLKSIVGGPIQMKNQDILVKQLNEANCPTGVLPEEACVALAGFASQGIVIQIEKALRAKFGCGAPTLPPIFTDSRTVIVAYAHLQQNLSYPRKFARSTTIPLRFDTGNSSTDVEFFGASERSAGDYSSQVQVLHYSGQDDFVLCLKAKNDNDFIVLAKMEKPVTLLAGVNQTRKHLRAQDRGFTEVVVNGKKEFFLNMLSHGDLLAVPIIDLNVAATFPQLCDRTFLNIGFERVWLLQVYQDINFKMDEGGAVVRSTAYAVAAAQSSRPRRFVFDKPFLLTLWRKNAEQPYLASWVASPDVLVPFKKK